MTKILTAPLFTALSIALIIHVVIFLRARSARQATALTIISFLCLFDLAIISTPACSKLLQRSIVLDESLEGRCPKDGIVVLSGGMFYNKDLSRKALCGETLMRTIGGIELFKRCRSQRIVMTGFNPGGPKTDEVEMMGALAVDGGVPKEAIVLEPDAINTMAHPVKVIALNVFKPDADIAVVTSPWHLRRAMIEFKKFFPNSFPAAAYDNLSDIPFKLPWFVPNSDALNSSTYVINEYVGILWYRLLSWRTN